MSRLRRRFCPSTTNISVEDTGLVEEFDTSISRSGKWSVEEESFAKNLIIQFESGTAKDCEEGCTLRAYLARRLNCAPMRVSKKFAGKVIGKHVFVKSVTGVAHATVKDAEKMLQNPTRRVRNTPKRYRSDSEEFAISERKRMRANHSVDSDDDMDYTEEEDEEFARVSDEQDETDHPYSIDSGDDTHETMSSWVDKRPHYGSMSSSMPHGGEDEEDNFESMLLRHNNPHNLMMPSSATNTASVIDQSATNHLLWTLDQELISESDSYYMDGEDREADEWRNVLSYFTGSSAASTSDAAVVASTSTAAFVAVEKPRNPTLTLSVPVVEEAANAEEQADNNMSCSSTAATSPSTTSTASSSSKNLTNKFHSWNTTCGSNSSSSNSGNSSSSSTNYYQPSTAPAIGETPIDILRSTLSYNSVFF